MGPNHQRTWRLLPRFLREDYSPYRCGVSSNRENYGLRGRRIHLQNLLKTWFNTGQNPLWRPVECKACLFDTRIPNIYIGRDGLCNMCQTYKRNFKPGILEAELAAFLSTAREPGCTVDAAVAFSGGKDSTASLYLAKKRFALEVVAILVDNGFIPSPVIENGRRVCDRLGVELVVLPVDFAPDLRRMMDDGFRKEYPCYRCTEMFHSAIQKYCVTHGINRVILGRNWWRWLEPEVRAVRRVTDNASGMDIQFLSLPFALQMNLGKTMAVLAELGWEPVSIHGNSTNCLVPGLVEYPVFKRLGYHPELNLLSREVISGYLDKESAAQKMASIEDLTATLRRVLDEKLGSRTRVNG
jgi:hypothetical protein